MDLLIDNTLLSLPVFLAHSSLTLLMFVVGITIYVWITPHREFALIRENNPAAAIALGAAMLGLAIPLAAAMSNSTNIFEVAIWGVVALALQLIAFKIVDLLMRDLGKSIEEGKIAPAMVLAAAKLSVAVVNAAAMS